MLIEKQLICWRSFYSVEETYNLYDAVLYDGVTYVYRSNTAARGEIPGIALHWQVLE